MGREEIFRNVKNFKTLEELKKNKWILFMGESGDNGHFAIGSNKSYEIWVFKHLNEKGLRVKFQKEDDGSLTLLSCWDEKNYEDD